MFKEILIKHKQTPALLPGASVQGSLTVHWLWLHDQFQHQCMAVEFVQSREEPRTFQNPPTYDCFDEE